MTSSSALLSVLKVVLCKYSKIWIRTETNQIVQNFPVLIITNLLIALSP